MRALVGWKSALSIALISLFALASSVLLYFFSPRLVYELDSVGNLGGRYRVRTYRKYKGGGAYCEIFLGFKRVYSRSGRQAFFVELLGPDVTSSGRPNLVLRQWYGSAHGDARYLVLELDGPKVEEIGVIDGLLEVVWQDVNGDGIPEVTGRDRAQSYFAGGDFAGSPRPTIVLSYDRARAGFKLDRELMSRRPLSDAELRGLSLKYKQDIRWRAGTRPPTGFVDALFQLIYRGNGEQAWQLLEASWPDGAGAEEAEFRRSVEDSLRRSPFYSAIAGWNNERK